MTDSMVRLVLGMLFLPSGRDAGRGDGGAMSRVAGPEGAVLARGSYGAGVFLVRLHFRRCLASSKFLVVERCEAGAASTMERRLYLARKQFEKMTEGG